MKEAEHLLEEIAGFLHTYLKAGKVGLNTFLTKTNINIENLNQLLTIRFLLKEETMSFVEDLPRLLTRFKTTTTLENEVHVGEVRGAIDWPETIKTRLAQNYKDPLIFSTAENIRSYATQENLVLKQLLGLLYRVLYEDDYIKGFENADWFNEWQRLKLVVRQALKKNTYIQRVPLDQVSDRMILQTCQHRNPLYSRAALLLAEYRKLMRGDYTQEELELLLRETFITPNNVDVLFELYWVVQMIKTNSDTSKLYLLDGTQNLVASWEKDHHSYRLYHDSSGSNDVQFHISSTEIADSDNPYLQQVQQSFDMVNQLAAQLFNQSYRRTYWQGRPDFLVEVRDQERGELVRLIIGEVKNTHSQSYAITGLRELLDYIHLVKDRKGEYLYGKVPVDGMLCVGKVEWNEEEDASGLVKLVTRTERSGIEI